MSLFQNYAAGGKMKKSLTHIVLVKFADTAESKHVDKIVADFKGLKNKIPGICGIQSGGNISKEGKSSGFTHCFILTFQDENSRDVYLMHPQH
jgi:hypothetical protein